MPLKLSVASRCISTLLVAVTCGCDDGGVTAPSSNETAIRGRVLDFSAETGIAGALVQFTGESLPSGPSATTDANGHYVISASSPGPFTVWVDGAFAGDARVTRPNYRGDLLIDSGSCISRYGTIADAETLVPVAGATVALGGSRTTSGIDGWYRIDLGCPSRPGFNTAFIYVTHPNYAQRQQVVGRGIHGVRRLDLALERRES